MQTRASSRIRLHSRVLMRGVVFEDELDIELRWRLPVKNPNEGQEFLVPMPLAAPSGHFASDEFPHLLVKERAVSSLKIMLSWLLTPSSLYLPILTNCCWSVHFLPHLCCTEA